MNKEEIQKTINSLGGPDEFYYYYNFDGIEVKPKLKKDKSCGFYNWEDKICPVLSDLIHKFQYPHVLDIGCNMAIYAHEMTKMSAIVTAIDKNIKYAEFYKKYVIENLKEEWSADLKQIDITKEILNIEDINIITMFCVIYHLHEYADIVIENFKSCFPQHQYLIVQGNTPRVKKKNQPLGGSKGIDKFLKSHGYKTSIYEWKGYPKPIVVGEIHAR